MSSLKRTLIESSYIASRWSFAFTRESLEEVLRRLKEVLRTFPGRGLEDVSWKTSSGRLLEDVLKTSPGRRLNDASKKVVATFISNQSKTTLRPNLRRFYDVFATSLCRLGTRCNNRDDLLHLTSLWKFTYITQLNIYDRGAYRPFLRSLTPFGRTKIGAQIFHRSIKDIILILFNRR